MHSNIAGKQRLSTLNEGKSEWSNSEDILFRRFSSDGDDERQMGELVFANAFLGNPFDNICPCKDWFADVVLGPYIRHQPENIHVALHKPSGRLIGYITGCTGGQQFEKLQYDDVRRKVVSLAASLAMPWSLFDHASRRFAAHVIFKGESERPSHPQSGVHWHFQVDKEFRGQGIGARLLDRFVADAMDAEFGLIWAEVMAYPEKPREYFEHRGWQIYDAKRTRIFGDHVDFPVEVMCITKPLWRPRSKAGKDVLGRGQPRRLRQQVRRGRRHPVHRLPKGG